MILDRGHIKSNTSKREEKNVIILQYVYSVDTLA